MDYKEINRRLWNKRTSIHLESEFYDNDSFLKGRNSLNQIELDLLGDVSGKRILHLQCHFGQDSLSLARMGAKVTGMDLSDEAIKTAKKLNTELQLEAEFICCDVYDLPDHLEGEFDLVFASYGTIGWLPDLDRYMKVVHHFLKKGGRFLLVEFHPFIWMYNGDFSEIAYSYFNREAILEEEESTYADTSSKVELKSVGWNHPLGEVLSAVIDQGMSIENFQEYDYSPYDIFNNSVEDEGKYSVRGLGDKIPYVYSLVASR